jgi:hypothetical protein
LAATLCRACEQVSRRVSDLLISWNQAELNPGLNSHRDRSVQPDRCRRQRLGSTLSDFPDPFRGVYGSLRAQEKRP